MIQIAASSSTGFRNVSRKNEDEELKLGEHLRAARKKAGLTQEQAAVMIDRPATSLSDWERGIENGGRIPHVRILLKLARAYGITLDELVTGSPPVVQSEGPSQDEWSGVRSLLRNARRVLEEEGDPEKRTNRVATMIEAAEMLTETGT
jgi:transcriptional regulator with XRE-family HTH domain